MVSDYIQIPYLSQAYSIGGLTTGSIGNRNLLPIIAICFYDDVGNPLHSTSITTSYPPDNQFWYGFQLGTGKITYIPPTATKIKIGISVRCYFNRDPCSGSIWFDDISFQAIGDIKAHKFEDLNRNKIQDLGELSLPGWEIAFYPNRDCVGGYTAAGRTNSNGDIVFKDIPIGDHSIEETFWVLNPNPPPYVHDGRTVGWTNTTSVCQNITLKAGESPIVYFGNIHGPTVPYFSQKDPAWAAKEYDHADTIGPFFCGTTIAGCGCAITSSAMLLKYYGVEKSPDGSPTNPDTLDTWLTNNSGYAFGALKWPSIASYALKANEVFGTQKIKFTGAGDPNDFATLNSELTANRPTILQEPGHFLVATGVSGSTYSINDPAWQDRTTLASYGDSFFGIRKFEKTNSNLSTIYISTPSPTQLLLTDSSGRKVGKDPTTGFVYNEIPNSFYVLEPVLTDDIQENGQTPAENSDTRTLVIINPQQDLFRIEIQSPTGNYSVNFSGYDRDGNISEEEISNQTQSGQFQINYSPDLNSRIQVTQLVDIDIKPGDNPNSINLKSNGVIPVAILSTDDFDPTNVDHTSIKFGPNKISEFHQKDHPEDTDRNGDIDLILHFKTKEAGFEENHTEACLIGKTFNNIPILGCDQIRILSL